MQSRWGGRIAAALFALLVAFYSWQIWIISVQPKHGTYNHDTKDAAKKIVTPETSDERIADYTEALAIFTALLVIVSGGQIWFLIRADKTARIMAETAQAQTAKMGDSADSAAKQTLIVGRQTDIQEKQHAIGRMQFFAMHRPKIILREAFIGTVLEGEQITVIMHFANIGSTTGTIVHSTVNVRLAAGVQFIMSGSTVDMHDDLGEITLVAGQSRSIRYPKDDAPKYEAERLKLKSYPTAYDGNFIERRDADIVLTGQLLYIDEIGTQRRTAFYRTLKPERRRFYPVSDEPDLDYSD